MARALIIFDYAIYFFYILASMINNNAGSKLKIDYLKSTRAREQPSFGYIRHVVELRIHDREYSKNVSIYIPASGVIVAPRFVLTAAHLFKRGAVSKIAVFHPNCGDRSLAFASYAETHINYKGRPPHYDIGLLLVHHEHRLGLDKICDKLKPAYLPKNFLAYNFGGRAILIGHEHYYEHFYFTTRRTTTSLTTTTTKDYRFYSSEYYSDSVEEPCCSTPRTMRLLRKRAVEDVIRIQNCPVDIDGYFFCSYEQNKTIPSECDIGTGVIDRFGVVIGILSFQRFVTYGSNINFYVDVAASLSWINPTIDEIINKELSEGNATRSKNPTRLKIL